MVRPKERERDFLQMDYAVIAKSRLLSGASRVERPKGNSASGEEPSPSRPFVDLALKNALVFSSATLMVAAAAWAIRLIV
jgi:hypothetical protein